MLRRMSTTTSRFCAATAVLLASGLAHAGVTIETTRGPDSVATMYLEGDRMRLDGADKTGMASSVIIDGGAKKLIVVEEKKKSYTELTEADMKRVRAQMDALRAQMEERMKTMSPEQRKQVEAMMAGMGGAPGKPAKPAVLKFEKLGQKKTINGFSCEMYRVLKDGVASEEDCIAAWSASTVQKSDLAGLRKFGEEMMKNFGSAGARDQIQLDQLDKYPGIPISRVPLEADGKRGLEEQVKSIKRGSVPAAKFAVPAGYTKKSLPAGGPPGP
jgi:hypothetical protein